MRLKLILGHHPNPTSVQQYREKRVHLGRTTGWIFDLAVWREWLTLARPALNRKINNFRRVFAEEGRTLTASGRKASTIWRNGCISIWRKDMWFRRTDLMRGDLIRRALKGCRCLKKLLILCWFPNASASFFMWVLLPCSRMLMSWTLLRWPPACVVARILNSTVGSLHRAHLQDSSASVK